jgi:hypothetical protein
MPLTRKGKTTVEGVAELAMRLGGQHLADHGSSRSRHDFTQRQLLACLILRACLQTTYRGVLELLAVSPNLREALGRQDKLPHYTPLEKFSARSQVLAIADAMIRTLGRAAGAPQFAKTSAAMAATGLETTTASAHFQSRAGPDRAPMGEGVGHWVVWEFAAVESGVGLGAGQRQVSGTGVDGQGQ